MLRGSPQGGCDCYAAGRVIKAIPPQGFFTMGCFTNSPGLVLHGSTHVYAHQLCESDPLVLPHALVKFAPRDFLAESL